MPPKRKRKAVAASEGAAAAEDAAKRPRLNAWGVTFMLFRVLVQEGVSWVYQTCTGKTQNREADSRHHRLARTFGFTSPGADQEDELSKFLAERQRLRGAGKSKSESQTVQKFALFERYVLTYHPDHEYAAYLKNIENTTKKQDFMVGVANVLSKTKFEQLHP